jgi:hypothetical protein
MVFIGIILKIGRSMARIRRKVPKTVQTENKTMTHSLNSCRRLIWVAVALLMYFPARSTAQEGGNKPVPTNAAVKLKPTIAAAPTNVVSTNVLTKNLTNTPVKVRFRPPSTGAPSVRLTGGSRGSGDAAITLDVLAPDDIGVTTQEQPSLFWYQSRPAEAKFELTLLQENKVKPLVQVMVDRSAKAGIQRINLADHGARLKLGVEYQWVVALITDPDNRSTDLVASGVIKRIEPSEALRENVRQAAPSALPGVYAEAGIWYDALASLSDQVEARPEDAELKASRADLLSQVGLKAASSF